MELRSEKNHRSHRRQNRRLAKVNHILFVIEALLLAYLGYLLIGNGVLSTNQYTYIGLTIVVLLLALQLFFNLSNRFLKTSFLVHFLSIVVFAFAIFKFQQVVNLFNRYTQNESVQEYTMSVVVLKDSGITDVSQLASTSVEAPTAMDKDNIDALVKDVKAKKNVDLSLTTVSNYGQAYQDLKAGTTKAMVLSSAYESLLANEESDFSEKTVKIYEYKVVKTVERPDTDTDQKTDTFNVYISGIDTYGPITEVSRSDVNIIATVNTTTKTILLTTTPRDSYVRIADGGNNQYDKLTHAGIYGVDASIHTLENLYDIDLDYYARVNFTTFMNLIDVVGGVDVYNEYAFDSYTIEGKVYPAGNLHLDAEDALGYVRERYNLVDGDVGRAAHQEQVITQILKKLLSSRLLTDSESIVSQLSESTQTNMKLNTVFNILNKLISTDGDFTIESQALEVTGQIGLPSYAMPGSQLWMGVVNQTSLAQVAQNINNVMQGKPIETGVTSTPGEDNTSTTRTNATRTRTQSDDE